MACVVTIARCGRHGGGNGPFADAPEKAVCVTEQKLESNSGSVAEEKGPFAGVAERGKRFVQWSRSWSQGGALYVGVPTNCITYI
jgi:hypothetical protein